MYLDEKHEWRPPEWPEKPARRLTQGQESFLMWIMAVNLTLLFVAPIAGVTLFESFLALWSR